MPRSAYFSRGSVAVCDHNPGVVGEKGIAASWGAPVVEVGQPAKPFAALDCDDAFLRRAFSEAGRKHAARDDQYGA